MESTPKILLVEDVASLCRVAKITIYRWKRQKILPNPIRLPGKIKWLASDIEAFLQSQSSRPPPVNVATAKQRRSEVKDHQERNKRAEATLERHRLNRRKSKRKQEP